jgi:predicted protein tyrosine phosphatase
MRPTTATRAAGEWADQALIPVDRVLIEWADHIVFADDTSMKQVRVTFGLNGVDGKERRVWALGLPDKYKYREPALVKAIHAAVKRCGLAASLGVDI